MGLSKKDARTREQNAKKAAGTLVPTTAAGVKIKPAKAQIQCTVCKAMIIASMPVSLRDHAGKHPKVKAEECFPGATIAP